jgi:hypothetical protein
MRRHLVFVLLAVLGSMGASYPTTNFQVEAPTPQIAQQVGQAAEVYRRQKAIDWLGHEMPPWAERCPIHVRVTLNGPSGATSFAFDRGQIRGQHMHIEGPLDRLLASVLPHEVTHTVFAHYFRCPVPRWADEGGAVLSEDEVEKERHDKLVRQILNTPGRMIPLRRLFALREYPGDVMVLYAEGFSVANFLVTTGGRQTFLGFIAHGMSAYGWDSAVRTFYRYNRVEELEEAWLAYLRSTKRPPVILAQNGGTRTPAEPTNRVIVRQTVPPTLGGPAPIVRGQSPSEQDEEFARTQGGVRPGYLPDPVPSVGKPGRDGWQPAGTLSYQPLPPPPSVQLLPPQAVPPPSLEFSRRPVPGPASPVGYPR